MYQHPKSNSLSAVRAWLTEREVNLLPLGNLHQRGTSEHTVKVN